ncbi:MAG: 30S ribosomal protein S9 [Bacteroidia bacterium]|nr:30S ribosomal protein S9 [Bacteroidia bacterium]MCC7534152.1 30S ribosomal protein S9 [Bacteroidia bacterium]MCZ2141667.1 30S ribosomal protein S9 [Bacteroidia bacterium]
MEVINALGRRKTSIARVYLTPGTGKFEVNGSEPKAYFPTLVLQHSILHPFEVTNTLGQFDVKCNVNGGGISGQADAIKLGVARALVAHNEELKPILKAEGLMTRDPRMVERKKPGQKKARKRFQFVKR